MGRQKTFEFNLQKLDRPKDCRRTIRRSFANVKCRECAKCCKEKPKHITLIPSVDPNYRKLVFEAAHRFKNRLQFADFDGYVLVGNESCSFLEKEGDESICSIYGFRPMVCSAYPFILQKMQGRSSNGETFEHPYVVLSGACPPLANIRDAGITFLLEADIRDAPLLHECYKNLIALKKQGIIVNENFFRARSSLIFPVS